MNFQRGSLLLAAVVLLAACNSIGNRAESGARFTKASLSGMVYSADSRPVRGARIRIDDGIEAQSDINGRFVTEPISPGMHSFVIHKEGFEPQTLAIEFSDRLQVLYVRLISLDYLLREAETRIDQEELDTAAALLDRAERIAPRDPALLMLKQVVAVKRDGP